MATHLSAKKRIRQTKVRREHNKYYSKTMRNALKKFRDTKEKDSALEQFPKVASMLDKLAKKNIIHKNKAANLKSEMATKINKM